MSAKMISALTSATPSRLAPMLVMLACCAIRAACHCTAAEGNTADQAEFFEAKIRPVLIEHCYACHNSAESAQGGLAVDHREAFLRGGDGGSVIKPRDAAASRLLAILRHEIDGLEMPESGPQLADEVIADFEQWIAAGAYDPRNEPPNADELAATQSWDALLQRRKAWWSFQPIIDHRVPSVPAALEADTELHPIDRFVLAKLTQKDLKQNPPADSATLVRRLHYALIGLPPSIEQLTTWTTRLDAASNPSREAAIESIVDELLASRHFGERWARHWMDWVRYAESHGSEGDPAIENAWMYRDYLIRALNMDIPYDQLVREHVAGDLLPEPRINAEGRFNESIIGTAHWRMVFHGFAPTDALDERVRFTDDQINAFSKAFLGMTISCARCHDHKFDAISQADYYALFGVLNSCRPGRAVIDLPEHQDQHRAALQDLKSQIRRAVADLWLTSLEQLPQRLRQRIESTTDTDAKQTAETAKSLVGVYRQIQGEPHRSTDAGTLASRWNRLRADGQQPVQTAPTAGAHHWDLARPDDLAKWFRHGIGMSAQPQQAGEFVVASEGDRAIAAIFPSAVYSHAISAKHAARLTSPDIKLDEKFDVWVQAIGDGGASLRYVVQNYPRNGTVYPVTRLTPQWRWHRYDVGYWAGDEIHIELTTARDAPLLVNASDASWFGVREVRIVPHGTTALQDRLDYLVPLWDSNLASPTSTEMLDQLYCDAIRLAIIAWRDGGLSDPQAELLDRCLQEELLANRMADLESVRPLVDRYRQLEAEIPVPRRVPSLDETAGRDQPLFVRGNHKQPGEVIPRRFLEAIDSTPYFPRMAAATSGTSGRLRLADDLLRSDNPLTRRVIVNRVWHHLMGRGIAATPDNLGRLGDPPTHPELLDWLACRLEDQGWSLKRLIRMIVLSKTWQSSSSPSETASLVDADNRLLSHANLHRLEAEAIRDAMLNVAGNLDLTPFGPPVSGSTARRSVYVNVRRNSLDPFLRVFDFPEPFSSTGRRDSTNVPAQSLTMMNDPRVIAAARSWAGRILDDAKYQTDRQRIDAMFMAALGRPATDGEVTLALAFIEQADRRYADLQSILQHKDAEATQLRIEIDQVLAPIRQRLLADSNGQPRDDSPSPVRTPDSIPQPMGAWDFDDALRDVISMQEATATGGATVQQGDLVTGGMGYAVTPPLTKPLRAKTLEAWLRLDNLTQRGGGVITVQTLDGQVFDSIVFAEKDSGQWVAGSNNFARTESFGGPIEREASESPVHVAIVYHEDGQIIGYRNGQPYGKPYQSRGIQTFAVGQSLISFGVRHLPAGGNRMLAGRIARARVYDAALTADQIRSSYETAPKFISDALVLDQLSSADRTTIINKRLRIDRIDAERRSLGAVPAAGDRHSTWTDLAHTLLTLPEFIYIR